jgi:hypothetical protein
MATATVSDGRHAYRPQVIGRVFGWFFLATILTSVPAYFAGHDWALPGALADDTRADLRTHTPRSAPLREVRAPRGMRPAPGAI